MTRHIPTVDQIIDAITMRMESTEPETAEREALTTALTALEDERTRQGRIEGYTAMAEGLIVERTLEQGQKGNAA